MPGDVFLKEAVPNKASVRTAFVSASQRLASLLQRALRQQQERREPQQRLVWQV